MMNREYSFQRPRMAGDSFNPGRVEDLRRDSGVSREKKVSSIQGNIKSLADITQALTGNRGTHKDRMNRIDSGRGVSRDAAQRMFEKR